EAIENLARAIMTTDTVPKWRSIRVDGENGSYTLTAVAKGAGMIRPDLATMLCFVVTDAAATPATLRGALSRGVDRSFNRITIDGDTSTNDTVLLMANGLSGVCVDDGDSRSQFQAAVEDLLIEMARWIVRDGEGVSKVVDVRVLGAPDADGAYRVADAVAHSPLVKTAFFGEDANWGRILAAAGRAGVVFDPDAVDLFFDDVQMVRSGAGCGPAAEAAATAVMKRPAFSVTLDLHAGEGASTLITGDFSLDYVRINADYRS
ncbi:MAG: bifunctional ornithine acetyltransferase/N-acetylglutamate synthase, partial [Desulfobacterales bacterium]